MRELKITKSITNREIASLDKYLHDIGKEPLVTADEEVLLAQRIKQGDQYALEKLVKANLRFVVSVAKQYQNQGLSLPDLINEGNIGLVKAVKRFDETRGFKLISYAVWWIRQSILQSLAEQARIVRLPLNQIGSLNKIKKAISKLEQKFERDPSIEELAESLEIPGFKIEMTKKIARRYISIDAPVNNDDESERFLDVFVPEEPGTDDSLMKKSLSQEIERCLATITKMERDTINLYYGIGIPHGLTLEEIANRFELTRERVRQIKEKALRRLRQEYRSKNLKPFLGQ
jgi:RNA polymerase primary sigma factor